MIVAIISDMHDQVAHLLATVEFLNRSEAEEIIFCGDFCSPFMLKYLQETDLPIHAVFGNNDGDEFRLMNVRGPKTKIYGELAELELGGWKIGVNHFPEIAATMAASGKYDLVCFGHNHTPSMEKVGDCLLLNPGSLMGFQPGKKQFVPATFALFDTENGNVSFLQLNPSPAALPAPTKYLLP